MCSVQLSRKSRSKERNPAVPCRCNKRTPDYSSSGPYSPMNGIPNGGVASPGMLLYKVRAYEQGDEAGPG